MKEQQKRNNLFDRFYCPFPLLPCMFFWLCGRINAQDWSYGSSLKHELVHCYKFALLLEDQAMYRKTIINVSTVISFDNVNIFPKASECDFYDSIFRKQPRFQIDVYLVLLGDKLTAPTNDRTHCTFVMIWETSMPIITQQLDYIFRLLYESKNVPVGI